MNISYNPHQQLYTVQSVHVQPMYSENNAIATHVTAVAQPMTSGMGGGGHSCQAVTRRRLGMGMGQRRLQGPRLPAAGGAFSRRSRGRHMRRSGIAQRARTSRKRNRRHSPVIVAFPALTHLIHQLVLTLTSTLVSTRCSTCGLRRYRAPPLSLAENGHGPLPIGRGVEDLSVGKQCRLIPGRDAVDGDEFGEGGRARRLCEPLLHTPRLVDVVVDDCDMNAEQIPVARLTLTEHSAAGTVGGCDVVHDVDEMPEAGLGDNAPRDDGRLRLPIVEE